MRKYLGYSLVAGALAAAACGTSAKTGGGSRATFPGGGASNGSGGNDFIPGGGLPAIDVPDPNGGAGTDVDPGNPNITHRKCIAGMCADFPPVPIVGDGVPADVAKLFGAPTNFTAGSLCALEPQLSGGGKEGAMMPANWVRPRFRVMAPTGIDTLEIRLHSAAEANDLVAYTTYKLGANGEAPSWYLPKEIWTGVTDAMSPAAGTGFANNAAGQPVTVTIRGVNSKAPGMPVGVTGDFNIAPVVSTGSMVFWTVSTGQVTKDSSKLLGFAVGDEGVAETLTLDTAKPASPKWTGEIGEDGGVLRGFYDPLPKLTDFVDGQVRCIGCHTTIPDGSGVLFGDDWPWSLAGAALTTGAIPTGLAPGAQAIMKTPWWGQMTMSKAHWKEGDHLIVSSYGTMFNSGTPRTKPWNPLPSYFTITGQPDDKIKWHSLAWINADYNAAIPVTIPLGAKDYGTNQDARNQAVASAQAAGGWGLIATGDANVSDVSPSLSHDGNSIVYVTTDKSPDGHPDATATTADIRVVPFTTRAGGTSAALSGASDPNLLEYYPSYSGDDKLIAFTQAPKPKPGANGADGPYYNPNGKIMVIPAGGGIAVPVAANDPNSCGGEAAGAPIINSWPKWSPDVFTANGKTYYFLVFSSARKYADEFSSQFILPVNPKSSFTGLSNSSQLYLVAVVVDNATNNVTTYPAVYIWNQNRTPAADGTAAGLKYSNLTPAWDPITLPPLDIPEVPSDVIPK